MFAKSVLVTGSNRGIGLGFIKHLAGKTEHLFAGCRTPSEAEELQIIAESHKNLVILELDVTKETVVREAVAKMAATVGGDGLNCIINNAGIIDKFQSIDEFSVENITEIFQTNVIGPSMLVRTCLPLLRRASLLVPGDDMSVSRAAILNITTVLASLEKNSTGKMYGYRMSKVALNMLSKNLSIDLREDKILVAGIFPGWVRTDMGGRNALIPVTTSVDGMLRVADVLRNEDSGSVYSWDETKLPW